MIPGQHYNHDPHHFRFPRQMHSAEPIEVHEASGSIGDRIVFWCAVAIAVLLLFI